MKKIYKSIAIMFMLLFVVVVTPACSLFGSPNTDIVIVYTTDVRCGVDENIGYASLASYVKKIKSSNNNFTLIDAGDAMQGNIIGSLSKGKYIIELMNMLKYNIYTLGNHDFDYGLDELKNRISEFNGDVISCNISYIGENENKLQNVKPYKIIDYGVAKVGYVGVTMPTVATVSNPKNFKENDEIAYTFAGDNLYDVVQENIDECHASGCEYVVLVTHLGYLNNYSPNSSPELIANTTGAIAVIDGHSHQTLPCSYYNNKDGELIPLCTAGNKMSSIGRITITKAGDVQLGMISSYQDKDKAITQKIEEIEQQIDDEVSKVVATSDLALSLKENGIRISRSREVGLGDLVADAFRVMSDADIGFINGGGLRDDLASGELTYEDIKNVTPYDNILCVVKASGQKILDYLEFASRITLSDYTDGIKAIGEYPGFAQVSGLKYTIDTSIESTVELNEFGEFVGVSGERRVKDVYVLENGVYVPLDANKEYTIGSLDFILTEGGDGANMFTDCEIIANSVMIDSEAVISYIVNVLHGNLRDLYEVVGERITIM